MFKLQPGDIVLIYRQRYKGPFSYLITRIILFCTTDWWKKEPTSKVYHAEMVYEQIDDSNFRVIDMEPPKCRFKDRRFNRKVIFRLKNKPEWFDDAFYTYILKYFGVKYDFVRFILFSLLWLFLGWNFLGKLFSKWFYKTKQSVCSVFVARFYQYFIGIECSIEDAEISTPDDICDYCVLHTEKFEKIFDSR